MKRILFVIAVCVTACSGGDYIQSRVEHFVRSTYNDVDRVFQARVDTVTFGDNMDYRIEQARNRLEFASTMVRDFSSDYAKKEQQESKAWLTALDSLKAASGSVLDEPTAYNCIVSYNTPGNIVWVQLDKNGNLLNITKDVGKVLLNPGDDVPGYFELWKRFNGR